MAWSDAASAFASLLSSLTAIEEATSSISTLSLATAKNVKDKLAAAKSRIDTLAGKAERETERTAAEKLHDDIKAVMCAGDKVKARTNDGDGWPTLETYTSASLGKRVKVTTTYGAWSGGTKPITGRTKTIESI